MGGPGRKQSNDRRSSSTSFERNRIQDCQTACGRYIRLVVAAGPLPALIPMQVLKIILICAEVVMLFNLLIIVHELGHYLAARWRGLVVERFGVWFGKPIWKKEIGGVQYCLGTVPAGGVVALPQMAPMEAIEGTSETAPENMPRVSP